MSFAAFRYSRLAILVIISLLLSWSLHLSNRNTSLLRLSSSLLDDAFPKLTGNEWIWSELSSSGKDAAMSHVKGYMDAFIQIIKMNHRKKWISHGICNIELVGSQWGAHQLCTELIPPDDCSFISLGIANDFTFDLDLASRWNCHGFAADPTVTHPSSLHRLVTFHNIAAKTMRMNNEDKKKDSPWWYASVPSIKKFLNMSHIHVLKMDCEGCEFSLARDIIIEEPDFFHHVDQFTFEVHLNRNWLNDTESFYYFALLFKLMDDAGLTAAGSKIAACGSNIEESGWIPELKEINYPISKIRQPRYGRSCHEYLFARIPKQGVPK